MVKNNMLRKSSSEFVPIPVNPLGSVKLSFILEKLSRIFKFGDHNLLCLNPLADAKFAQPLFATCFFSEVQRPLYSRETAPQSSLHSSESPSFLTFSFPFVSWFLTSVHFLYSYSYFFFSLFWTLALSTRFM